eukprot:gene18733-biopygen17438
MAMVTVGGVNAISMGGMGAWSAGPPEQGRHGSVLVRPGCRAPVTAVRGRNVPRQNGAGMTSYCGGEAGRVGAESVGWPGRAGSAGRRGVGAHKKGGTALRQLIVNGVMFLAEVRRALAAAKCDSDGVPLALCSLCTTQNTAWPASNRGGVVIILGGGALPLRHAVLPPRAGARGETAACAPRPFLQIVVPMPGLPFPPYTLTCLRNCSKTLGRAHRWKFPRG